MSNKNLEKYLPLIELLHRKKISRKCFVSLFESFNDETIKFICECVQNAISRQHFSQLKLKKRNLLMKKIKPYKSILKKLCKTSKCYKKHKQIIIQEGYGVLFPILSTIIPLITSLIAK